jgi:hypothetical protein
MERELLWKAREAQNDAIQWGADVESSASSEEGWPGVLVDAVCHESDVPPFLFSYFHNQ